ncbi:hypothetical protein HPB47_018438 [Ixodes persulcatus]|uniref:Uncharacterized protein n=1 Tax=Ixodes persulcatus TaxID=34615 RepID=A0AC60QKR3_IXOPE|nr:hypothetical protein HPB47_018438 [Ixodes persulcatus]
MSASSEGMAGTSESKPSPFKLLKSEGKRLLKDGDFQGALLAFEKACKVCPDDRLAAKILKIKEYLETNDDQEEEANGMVEIGNEFYVYEGIEKKLYAYQREGLLWMWGLYLKKRGGVLGDDMGLGKTIQVIAFLSGMFDADLIKSVLLIMPVSLIPNWKKEFQAWAPGIRGHKIKNPTKTTKAVYELPAKHRLVLTGTAIQNNLRELWALYNFAHQGTLLGSLATFRSQYETHINRSREKDATAGERLLGIEISKNLMEKISPFFLRRTKAEVLENKENTEQETDSLRPKLCFTAKKNDLVVWVYLSEVQKKIYREFLESEEVANILMTKKSPLLLLNLKSEGHRTLFFSQSRKILDIIQRILLNRGFRVTRLDGTITKLCERDRLVTQFQTKSLADIFLLTTQVGGVGLTLTSADRVVIYDPSWNPATDAQAVDRAYRIGQSKNVVVYRLVTCSTVEEKIYRRQIFKDSIIKQTTGKQRDPTRYFTKQELRELFTLEDPSHSATQVQLAEMHSHHKKTDHGLDAHIEFIERRNVFGVSHHDLMFSEETAADGPEEYVAGEKEHVRMRVEIAHRMVTSEADFVMGEIQNKESYTVPLNITVKTRQPVPYQPTPNLFPIVVPDEDSADTKGVGKESDEELFPEENVQGDSIVIDSDDEELDAKPCTVDYLEIKGIKADIKVEQKPACGTSTAWKSEPEDEKNVRSPFRMSVLKMKEEQESFGRTAADCKIASKGGSFFSPLRNAMESRKGDSEVKTPRLLLKTDLSFIDHSSNSAGLVPKKEFFGSANSSLDNTSFVSLTPSSAKGVKQESPTESNISGQPMADNVRRHLFFGEDQKKDSAVKCSFNALPSVEEKRQLKKRLRDSPVFSPVPSGPKHLLLSPSAEQASPSSKQSSWSPKFKSSPLVSTPLSLKLPVECQNQVVFPGSSPSNTPSKRITPLLLGSPRRQRRSSMLKQTASPFQKALAQSRELSPVESPKKVSQNRRSSALHSQSVHEISSSDEEETGIGGGPLDAPHSKLLERSVHALSSSDEGESGGSENEGLEEAKSSLVSEDGVAAVRNRRHANRILSDDESMLHSATSSKPAALDDTDDELITDDEDKGWGSISCSLSPRKDQSDTSDPESSES